MNWILPEWDFDLPEWNDLPEWDLNLPDWETSE
jgi:hypothetical protein